jgi:hypothetical protein
VGHKPGSMRTPSRKYLMFVANCLRVIEPPEVNSNGRAE